MVGSAVRWRAGSLVTGKLVALARTVALAHMLSPTEFGLYALALVPVDLLIGMTETGAVHALVQRDRPTARECDVAWTIGLLRGAGIFALLWAAGPWIALMLGEANVTPMIRMLAFRPLITAAGSIRVAELERELRYRPLAMVDLLVTAGTTIPMLVLAPSLGAWALVWGSLVGAAAGSMASYVVAPRRPAVVLARSEAGSLLRFGRWILAGGLLAIAGESIVRLLIGRELGTSALGRFSLAAGLASAPGGIVGAVVGAVAFSLHSRSQRDDARARELFRGALLSMSAVLLPVYAMLILLAPRLVSTILGPRWIGTETIIQLLAVVGMLGVVFDSTAPLLQGRGAPRSVTLLHAAFALGTLALVVPLSRWNGLEGAALARVLVEMFLCVACLLLAARVLRRPLTRMLVPSVAIVLSTALTGALAAWVGHSARNGLEVLAGAVASLLAGGGMLWALDRRLDLGFSTLLSSFASLPPSRVDQRAAVDFIDADARTDDTP